jgi:hypothetical protein
MQCFVWLPENLRHCASKNGNRTTEPFKIGEEAIERVGGETWFVTNNITQKLQAFLNRCLRNILGIWRPQIISNEKLWKITGQPDINVKIKRRKFENERESENEICYSPLEWNPQGRKSRACPTATWRRTILAECGKTSAELRDDAKYRRRWNLKVDMI